MTKNQLYRFLITLFFIAFSFNFYTQGNRNQTYVIIVGVSDYPNLSNDQQLKYADDDAELILNYFLEKEDIPEKNISCFINKEANAHEFISKLRNILFHQANENDIVIIYFAGHGDVDKEINEGYFLFNKVDPPNDSGYEMNDAVSFDLLKKYIEKASQKKIKLFLFTDACRSGIVISDQKYTNYTISSLASNWSNSYKIASCLPHQNSIEGNQWSDRWGEGHGVFSYYLVNGLKGLADTDKDQIITFKELERYVEDNVSEETSNVQIPSCSSSDPRTAITTVNENQKKEASLSLNSHIENIKTLSSNRSINNQYENISLRLKSIIQIYEKLIDEKVFFKDEIINQEINEIQQISYIKQEQLKIHKDRIDAIDKSPNGKYTATASHDNTIKIIDLNSLTPIKTLIGHSGGVRALKFSPSGKYLASGGWDNNIIIWDYLKEKEIKEIKNAHTDDITSLAYINERTLISGSADGNIKIWDLNNLTSNLLEGHEKKINDIEFIGDTIYSASDDGTIKKWNIKTFQEIKSIKAHSGKYVKDLCLLNFSNKIISVGYDGNIKFWGRKNLNFLNELSVDFYKQLNSIDVDPLENFCFTASVSYKIEIYNLNPIFHFQWYKSKKDIIGKSGISCLMYDPINHLIEIGDYQGYLRRHYNLKESLNYNETILNFNASDLHDTLIKVPELNNIKYLISGTFIAALNKSISDILYPLVNGKPILPDISSIQKGIKYAEKAIELSTKDNDPEIYTNKLIINKYLLETFLTIQLKDHKNYTKAIEKINKIKELDPDATYIYNILGTLYKELKELKEAKENVLKAEELVPLWAEAPCNFGKIFIYENNYKEAEIKFKETIEKGPNQSKGYYNLAVLYMKLGDFINAEINFSIAFKIDPQVDYIVCSYAELLYKTGQKSKALQLLNNKKLLEYPMVKTLLAKLKILNIKYQSNEKYTLSVLNSINTLLIDALIESPYNPMIRNTLGVFYQNIKNLTISESFTKNKKIWRFYNTNQDKISIQSYSEFSPLTINGIEQYLPNVKINNKIYDEIVVEWLIEDNTYVQKNKPILKFNSGLKKKIIRITDSENFSFPSGFDQHGLIYLKSNLEGIISKKVKSGDTLKIGELYCLIDTTKKSIKNQSYKKYKSIDHVKQLNKISRELIRESCLLDKDNYYYKLNKWLTSNIKNDNIEQFINSKKNTLEANYIVGRYFQIKKEFNKAIKYYKICLKIDPGHLLSYLNTININNEIGKSNNKIIELMNQNIPNCNALEYIDNILEFDNFN